MPALLISGPSASGKTTVGSELARRRYPVIDMDQTFGHFGDRVTGEPVPVPDGAIPDETWYSTFAWLWRIEAVQAKLEELADETIFLVGGALNESDIFPRLAGIFRLHLRPDVLDERLASRADHRYTSSPAYRRMMHALLARAPMDAARGGWVLIDTSDDPVRTTVDRILNHLGVAPVPRNRTRARRR